MQLWLSAAQGCEARAAAFAILGVLALGDIANGIERCPKGREFDATPGRSPHGPPISEITASAFSCRPDRASLWA